MAPDPHRKTPQPARAEASRLLPEGRKSQRNHTAGIGPLELILGRLEGVKRTAKGFIARCPAHGDRSPSLSLSEGHDGRALLHCFGGCDAIDVVQAVGLTLGDLFPVRLNPQTPAERRQAQQYAKESGWRAALSVLATEATTVHIAARQLAAWRFLSQEDDERLSLACSRIDRAALVLTQRERWRPNFYYPPSRLVSIKRGAVTELQRELERAEKELSQAEEALARFNNERSAA